MKEPKLRGLLQISRHIIEHRSRQGIRLSEMARLVGYGNINTGVRRLHRFESEGIITEKLLQKIVEALDIPAEDLKRLIEQDRVDLEWRLEEWCSRL
jgi:hypothetical protein